MNEMSSKMIRAFIILFVVGLFCSAGYAASYAIGRLIPELHLKDGTVLHSATVVSVGSTGVMAKWDGGRGNIKFSILPDDALAVFAKVPLPPPPPDNRSADEKDWAKEQAERDAVLQQPEPTLPPTPRKVKGDIGKTDGPPKVIHGQVFVTTKGGVNYKLGVVTVYVYGNNEFVDLYAKVRAEIKPTLDYYTTMAKRALANYQTPMVKLYMNDGYSVIDSELTLLPEGPRTETDGDGNFELRHTIREPFVIVAKATRVVGDDVERYQWAVPSSKIGADGKLLLSNSNMQE